LLLLFTTALIVSLLEAFFIDQPGTMDACYYYSGGVNIFQGRGMNEFFYWNYLEGSVSLPHPGFLYWMPLPSIVAASGMLLLQNSTRRKICRFCADKTILIDYKDPKSPPGIVVATLGCQQPGQGGQRLEVVGLFGQRLAQMRLA